MSFNLTEKEPELDQQAVDTTILPQNVNLIAKEGTTVAVASGTSIDHDALAGVADMAATPASQLSDRSCAKEDGSAAGSDSDSEDWDEISKGRYFGGGDDKEQGPLCHNCKQTGHKKKDCPHQLCRSCGALDDHDTMRCPMTQRCYNCSRLGHMASKCPEPYRQVGSFCHDCGSRSHLERSCPQIWRLYLPSPAFDPNGSWTVEAWCYNCAAKGHYGDDCDKPHRMRLIEQSAFCQANQPESRFDRAQREAHDRKQSARHTRLDDDEARADDWFARQASLNKIGSRRTGSNHNSFQDGNSSYGYPPPPPPPPPASRGSRQQGRYDPYARPSGPIITSERYPRGLPSRGAHANDYSPRGSKQGSQKRKPVPAAQRLAMQNQNPPRPNSRGGKAYRGGGRR